MDDWRYGSIGWRRPLAALALVAALCVAGVTLMGTQVSRVLSTVGAAVPQDRGAGTGGGAIPESNQGPGAGNPGPGAASGGGGGRNGADAVSASMLDAARPDLLVIKTGEISIRAASIGPAIQKVTTEIVALGGYASGSTRSGTGADATASMTFRVPASHWEAALTAARGAGDEVVDEQTQTEDVTGDVVDLRARIRNLQATEAAIEAIMARASSIDEVLDVQGRLSDVRGQIEQLSSKAADLEARAVFSTLTVRVGVRPIPVAPRQKPRFDPAHEADAATARLVRILEHAEMVGIWVGIVWLPILAAIALLGSVGFLVARRARRTLGGNVAGPPPLPEGGP